KQVYKRATRQKRGRPLNPSGHWRPTVSLLSQGRRGKSPCPPMSLAPTLVCLPLWPLKLAGKTRPSPYMPDKGHCGNFTLSKNLCPYLAPGKVPNQFDLSPLPASSAGICHSSPHIFGLGPEVGVVAPQTTLLIVVAEPLGAKLDRS